MALIGEGDLQTALIGALRPLGYTLSHQEGHAPGGETERFLFTRAFDDGTYMTMRWTGKWSPRSLEERGLVEIGGRRIHRTDESCVFEYAFPREDGSVMRAEVREYFDEKLTAEHLQARARAQEAVLRRTKALVLAAESY